MVHCSDINILIFKIVFFKLFIRFHFDLIGIINNVFNILDIFNVIGVVAMLDIHIA